MKNLIYGSYTKEEYEEVKRMNDFEERLNKERDFFNKAINASIYPDPNRMWIKQELSSTLYTQEETNGFKAYTDKLAKTLKQKNTAYGNSATETFGRYGLISYIVRLEDKFNRLRNLEKNKNISIGDESIKDTLTDMAGYCVLALMDLDRRVGE